MTRGKHNRRNAKPRLMYTHMLPTQIALAVLMGWALTQAHISHSYAQSAAPITSSGLNTQVSAPIAAGGKTQLDITGGTRAGSNLFHSFGTFNVPTNNIANFLNDSGLDTANILGRVTGETPSSIFGTIQTTGFGNANLFLINPAGIVFGPNASLNVGGSVTFTTANHLRLGEENGTAGIFHADSTSSNILTSAPVTAFGFLTSTSASIAVQGSRLSVPQGKALSLVGGNHGFDYIHPDTHTTATVLDGVTITTGTLIAPGGQINMVSVASPGEISTDHFTPAPDMKMGKISLSQESVVDVSANGAGMIRIRGGQLIIDNATLSANTVNSNSPSVAIDVRLTDDFTLADTRALPAITASTSGVGNAGAVEIVSANMRATSTDPNSAAFALIDTHSSGEGHAGNVNIMTGTLTVSGPAATWHVVDSGPRALGSGGNITITARDVIDLTGTAISTGSQLAASLGGDASGPGGNLTISANHLQMNDTLLATAAVFEAETQRAGNVLLNVGEAHMINSSISAAGFFGGGGVTINADRLTTDATQIDTFTAFGPALGITFNGHVLELTNGSNWSTSTFGDGNAGDIRITATEHARLIGITGPNPLGASNPTGVFSNSFGDFGGQGGSGNVFITTPRLTMREGRINSSTATSGRGGDVIINAGTIDISGEFPNPGNSVFFGITDIHPSGIFTQTVGTNSCPGSCGTAGHISVTTSVLNMGPGAQINSGTTNNGSGGTIDIHSSNTIALSGRLTDGNPVGVFSRSIGTAPDSGSGGNISLSAGRSVTINDGAAISAGSDGPGNAGNISIDAGQEFTMQDGSVTTSASQATGGNIKINATDLIRVVNGRISTSVLGGTGDGGNISIDPHTVILQNSKIMANAVAGNGGNIVITTPLFLADQSSLVDASSQFGLHGTVTIQSPTSNLSGTVGQLASKTSPPQVLLQNRCVAMAGGGQSTFLLSGREALPLEPGGWLNSPVSMEHLTGEGTEQASGLMVQNKKVVLNGLPIVASREDETTILSLRRLTPSGFLVRTFATGSTGCPS